MVSRVENQLLLHQVIEDLKPDLLDIFKKKKCNGNVTKQKIPYITFKKEQTSKQTKKSKNKTKQIPGLDF